MLLPSCEKRVGPLLGKRRVIIAAIHVRVGHRIQYGTLMRDLF